MAPESAAKLQSWREWLLEQRAFQVKYFTESLDMRCAVAKQVEQRRYEDKL